MDLYLDAAYDSQQMLTGMSDDPGLRETPMQRQLRQCRDARNGDDGNGLPYLTMPF